MSNINVEIRLFTLGGTNVILQDTYSPVASTLEDQGSPYVKFP